jgi:hypothetical protein
MQSNGPDSVKTAGSHDKQITVELDDGRVITAQHHIVNDEAQLMHLYLGDRSDGIDVTIPLAGSLMTAAARTDRGREALGIDTQDDVEDDRVLVADGGRDDGVTGVTIREGPKKSVKRTVGDIVYGGNAGLGLDVIVSDDGAEICIDLAGPSGQGTVLKWDLAAGSIDIERSLLMHGPGAATIDVDQLLGCEGVDYTHRLNRDGGDE